MTLTLRYRILLTLVPLLLLLAVVGTAGVVLLLRLGNSVNAILRDNYDSVVAMEHLNEALERIDSSFQFARSGREREARQQYDTNWPIYTENLELERKNVTLPGEGELAAELTRLSELYRVKGDAFYARPGDSPEQERAYFDENGLLELFKQIKDVSTTILRLNQSNMEKSNRDAQELAVDSLMWFGAGLAVALILAGFSAWHTIRTILQPIQAMTSAASGISAGDLDQLVPYVSRDELGQLAQAFNSMARHLRDYRQSQTAQLLRAQQTSQATVDSFPDPVLVIDTEGYVEMANPAARRLLGVVARPKGQPGVTWQPPDTLRQPLAEALRDQRDYSPEGFDKVILLGSTGPERAVLPRILAIRDPYGNTLGAAVLLQDVTRLRLLDQVKSNLVATASHELKTPLTSIRLAVHLLLEERIGPLSAKQIELLIDARDNSERLLEMINNLLDLARLEQGSRQLDIIPERPEALLRSASDAIRARAEDEGIEIVFDIAPGVPAVPVDAARLATALRNLLDNALTYTERGGRITLSAARHGDFVAIGVADTGVGIPPEHISHVFEKFFRVPGQTRGSGTGLGLAIVREIVTAHGGSITCRSVHGQGTTFRILLPIVRDSRPDHVEGLMPMPDEKAARRVD